MKPVAIFRHAPQVGPGHFADYLNELAIPSVLMAVDEGVPIPESPHAFSGLCFMGGPMSCPGFRRPWPWSVVPWRPAFR